MCKARNPMMSSDDVTQNYRHGQFPHKIIVMGNAIQTRIKMNSYLFLGNTLCADLLYFPPHMYTAPGPDHTLLHVRRGRTRRERWDIKHAGSCPPRSCPGLHPGTSRRNGGGQGILSLYSLPSPSHYPGLSWWPSERLSWIWNKSREQVTFYAIGTFGTSVFYFPAAALSSQKFNDQGIGLSYHHIW